MPTAHTNTVVYICHEHRKAKIEIRKVQPFISQSYGNLCLHKTICNFLTLLFSLEITQKINFKSTLHV